jgi:ribonuclease BN (tRNA processing enzyme)
LADVAGLTLRVVGCGDAFGTGGRFNTCFHVAALGTQALIDCGASSFVALRQAGIEPADIDAVFITHLHGDHFGGVPFLLLDAAYNVPRTKRLTIAGPAGVEARVFAAFDALFPGSHERVRPRVPLAFLEWAAGSGTAVGPFVVTPLPVSHPSGSTSFALRVESQGVVVGYSGDTEWVDALTDVARGADLFICECSSFDTPLPFHLSYVELVKRRQSLAAKRVLLTHLGRESFARRHEIDMEVAEDGLVIKI